MSELAVRSYDKALNMKTPEQIKRIARNIGHGAHGFIDATFGRNQAPEEIIALRRQICELCEKNSPCIGSSARRCCGPMLAILNGGPECGCVIEKKTSLSREACPLGHWSACDAETETTESESGSSTTSSDSSPL